MVIERREEVGPRLVQSTPGLIVGDVLDEERVVAVVLDRGVEVVPLRLVVRVVERRGNRVAVGGGRLAVRDLGDQAGELLDSGPPRVDVWIGRVGQERRRVADLGGGLPLGLAVGDPAADDARPASPGCPAQR